MGAERGSLIGTTVCVSVCVEGEGRFWPEVINEFRRRVQVYLMLEEKETFLYLPRFFLLV